MDFLLKNRVNIVTTIETSPPATDAVTVIVSNHKFIPYPLLPGRFTIPDQEGLYFLELRIESTVSPSRR